MRREFADAIRRRYAAAANKNTASAGNGSHWNISVFKAELRLQSGKRYGEVAHIMPKQDASRTGQQYSPEPRTLLSMLAARVGLRVAVIEDNDLIAALIEEWLCDRQR